MPNGFVGTDLEERLREDGVESLVVAGMMSRMCGRTVPGATVHDAFMAALASGYATVVVVDGGGWLAERGD